VDRQGEEEINAGPAARKQRNERVRGCDRFLGKEVALMRHLLQLAALGLLIALGITAYYFIIDNGSGHVVDQPDGPKNGGMEQAANDEFASDGAPEWVVGPSGKGFRARPKYNDPTFIATADEVILKIFELAKPTKDDVIFDLGCGDGRILYMAAKEYGCRGVGLETNAERISEAMVQSKDFNIGPPLVEIRHGDALTAKDIGDATIVVMYMFPKFMNIWQPIAKEKLKPGTRIYSHDFAWDDGDWEPDQTIFVRSSTRDHKIHVWTVKEKK
jgi:hypothetical protein